VPGCQHYGSFTSSESWPDAMATDSALTDSSIARLVTAAAYLLQRVETPTPVLVEGGGRLVWAKDGAAVDDLFDAMDAVERLARSPLDTVERSSP
jgi:hypothetical protein